MNQLTLVLPEEGEKVGSGNILSLISAGGSARVYKTWIEPLELHRAVKIMNPDAEQETRDRFGTEARIAAKLIHPNIVQVHNFGETDGRLPYIEMEFIAGPTLRNVLRNRGALPLPVALAVMVGVLEAVHYAHTVYYTFNGEPQQGIMHRDIKPDNVIFSGGTPKLMDFGIARPLTVSLHTRQGDVTGTIPYMAPETCTGGETDFRSDIYQAGLLFYECISGNMAYPQTKFAPLVEAIKNGRRTPLNTNSKAEAVVRRCLELDPDKRYQTAQECLADVRALYHRQSPKILPETQISAFLGGLSPAAAPAVRKSGRSGVGKAFKAAAAVFCVVLAVAALALAGFTYSADILNTFHRTAAAPAEPLPEPAPQEAKPLPAAPTAPPRPKQAAARETPAQAAENAPDDALHIIGEGKNLLAQNRPQEALAKFQQALKKPSALAERSEIIKLSLYGTAECNSILYSQNQISRANYEAAWRSVKNVYPAGSAESAEADKLLAIGIGTGE